ncbi:amp-dependent synthetase and ligase [Nannochloropsis oceanica]
MLLHRSSSSLLAAGRTGVMASRRMVVEKGRRRAVELCLAQTQSLARRKTIALPFPWSLMYPFVAPVSRAFSVGFGGLQYDTLVEMQEKACKRYASQLFLGARPPAGGPFQFMTFKEFDEQVSRARVLLQEAGIGKGDKVAAISANRVEWAVCAYATFSVGAVWVPMYEQQRLKECEYILKDSGAKLLLVSKERIYDKSRHFVDELPTLQDVWCFDMDFHPRMKVVDPAHFIPSVAVEPDDTSTLIYTSGTTGTPKGVQLSHRNLTADVKGMSVVIPDDAIPVARSVAFLPWAHCFGKTCELHNALQRGAQVAVVEDLAALPAALLEVKPTMLYSVPTLFKRVYDKIQDKIKNEKPFTKALIGRALAVAEKRRLLLQEGGSPGPLLSLQFQALDKIVLSKFKAPLGGELNSSYVGGSAMPVEVANFFENIGVAICEGYGLTETSPLICVNPFNTRVRRTGTVGQLIGDADVRIVKDSHEVDPGEEGEVWVAGPFVFSGYHNKPAETAEAFAELHGTRYFKTGDLGRFVKGGLGVPLLKITGRVKELYKLENGKYVVPALIEKAMAEAEIVSQALVFGSDRPYNVAILVPNWEKLQAYGVEHTGGEVTGLSTPEEIGAHPKIQAYIEEQLTTCCKDKVKKYEMPTRVLLIKDAFSVENEMLTQKLSIKRHLVVDKYAQEIAALYAGDRTVMVA